MSKGLKIALGLSVLGVIGFVVYGKYKKNQFKKDCYAKGGQLESDYLCNNSPNN